MAKYPEVQKRCYDELTAVFGTDVKQPHTMSLLNQLPYLELTIKESMRLYPTIPVIARTAMEDIKLSVTLFQYFYSI